MLRVNFLIRHANPLDRVRAAARDAAEREAAFQLEQLESINLELETPENRVRVIAVVPRAAADHRHHPAQSGLTP
jgi:hypothetical protein